MMRIPIFVHVAMFIWLGSASAAAQNRSGEFDRLAAMASSARDQGDTPRAIEFYQRAVQIDPKWPDGWWYLGSLQYEANDYKAAIDALTHYVELIPGAGPALALRGLCEFEDRAYPRALQDIQRAIALGAANKPENSRILLYHEALLLTRTGRFEEALGKYALFVKQGMVNEDVTMGIGLSGLRLPIFPQEVSPSQAELVSIVGQAAIRIMSGDLSGGNQAFQDIFHRYPNTANIHYVEGYLLFSSDTAEAVNQFREELAIAPSSAVANAMLAWALGSQGDFAAALPYAQKAVSENRSLLMSQLVLGRALVETGDVKDGLPHLEEALKSDPQNLEAHLTRAKAFSKLGRKDDARRERLLCLAISGQGTISNATM